MKIQQGDIGELGEEALEKDSGNIGLSEDILLNDPQVLAVGNSILEEDPALKTLKTKENGNTRGVEGKSPRGEKGLLADDDGIG